MHRKPVSRLAVAAALLMIGQCLPLPRARAKVAKKEAARPDVRLFDTTSPSLRALSSNAMSGKNAWVSVPEGALTHTFKGDAVFMNDRVAIVLRNKGQGAEVYGRGPLSVKLRATLTPTQKVTKLARVRITNNDPSEAAVDATYEAPGGKTVTVGYRLKMGQALDRKSVV